MGNRGFELGFQAAAQENELREQRQWQLEDQQRMYRLNDLNAQLVALRNRASALGIADLPDEDPRKQKSLKDMADVEAQMDAIWKASPSLNQGLLTRGIGKIFDKLAGKGRKTPPAPQAAISEYTTTPKLEALNLPPDTGAAPSTEEVAGETQEVAPAAPSDYLPSQQPAFTFTPPGRGGAAPGAYSFGGRPMSGVTSQTSPLAISIARAEGWGDSPTQMNITHNPGNLKIGDQGRGTLPNGITIFGSEEEGWNALEAQVHRILTGIGSKLYSPDMTFEQVAQTYVGTSDAPNWARNVSRYFGASPDARIGDVAGSPSYAFAAPAVAEKPSPYRPFPSGFQHPVATPEDIKQFQHEMGQRPKPLTPEEARRGILVPAALSVPRPVAAAIAPLAAPTVTPDTDAGAAPISLAQQNALNTVLASAPPPLDPEPEMPGTITVPQAAIPLPGTPGPIQVRGGEEVPPVDQSLAVPASKIRGLLMPGNLPIWDQNVDLKGTVLPDNDKWVVVPDRTDAAAHYNQTHENFGTFGNQADAQNYANVLNKRSDKTRPDPTHYYSRYENKVRMANAKAMQEAKIFMAGAPLGPEEQTMADAKRALATITARMQVLKTARPDATPDQETAWFNQAVNEAFGYKDTKPTLKLYESPDKQRRDWYEPSLHPDGWNAVGAGKESADERARADFAAWLKMHPEYKGTYEQWKVEQSLLAKRQTPIGKDDRYIDIQTRAALGQRLSQEDQAYMAAYMLYIQQRVIDPSLARAQGFTDNRFVQVVDPEDPERVTFMRAADAARMGASSPASIAYKTDQAITRYFTSGPGAQNLNYFNTAISHLEMLSEAADALKNHDIVKGNEVANNLINQFGDPRIVTFDAIKNAVAGELAKTFKGGPGTETQMALINGELNMAMSPAQLHGVINSYVNLMRGKRKALEVQFEQGKQGKPAFNMPEAPTTGGGGGSTAGAGGGAATGGAAGGGKQVSLAAAMQKYQSVHPGASKQDVINALKGQGIDYKDDVK